MRCVSASRPPHGSRAVAAVAAARRRRLRPHFPAHRGGLGFSFPGRMRARRAPPGVALSRGPASRLVRESRTPADPHPPHALPPQQAPLRHPPRRHREGPSGRQGQAPQVHRDHRAADRPQAVRSPEGQAFQRHGLPAHDPAPQAQALHARRRQALRGGAGRRH
jgi:hypothetical protein